MCGYFCMGLTDFMLKVRVSSKNWLAYTNLFSAKDYNKNDQIILKYFQ